MNDTAPSLQTIAPPAIPRTWRSLLTGRWHRSSWVVAAAVLLLLVFCNVPGQVVAVRPKAIGAWFGYCDTPIQHGWPWKWAERDLLLSPAMDGTVALLGVSCCWRFWDSPHYCWPALAANLLVVSSLSLVCGTLFEVWRRSRTSVWQLHLRDIFVFVFVISLIGGWYVYHRERHAREQQLLAGAVAYDPGMSTWQFASTPHGIGTYKRLPGGPNWLRAIAGDELFRVLDYVIEVRVDENGLARLPDLPDVRAVHVIGEVASKNLSHLGRVPRLEMLLLSNPPLLGEEPPPIDRGFYLDLPPLPKLRCLVIEGKPCGDLNRVPSLECLHWSGAPADEQLLQQVSGLKNLRELMLADCAVDWHRLQLLRSLPKLQRLKLRQTNISDDQLMHVGGLAELRELTISGCPLMGRNLKYLASLSHLESLDLSHTHVDDGAIEQLVLLKNLRHLDLWETRVSASAIPHLAKMKQLQSLSLPQLRFTAAEERRLRAELPGCRITSYVY